MAGNTEKPSVPNVQTMQSTTQWRLSRGRGFWHQPAQMNLLSDLILLFSGIALIYGLVLWVLAQPFFSLQNVILEQPPKYVTVDQVQEAAQDTVKGSFFSVNIDQVRASFEVLPWVKEVEVKRSWPDGLVLQLEEQQPVAYWHTLDEPQQQSYLLNVKGEVFAAHSTLDMPSFYGPQGSSAYMHEYYKRFSDELKSSGRTLSALWLSARYAWQLKLDDGLVILLGRDQDMSSVEKRLSGFLKLWPKARQQVGYEIAIADLRYRRGFALTPAIQIKEMEEKP